MCGTRDPLRQFEPSAAARRNLAARSQFGSDGAQESPRHLFTQREMAAAKMNPQVFRLVVSDRHRFGNGGHRFLDGGRFVPQAGQPGSSCFRKRLLDVFGGREWSLAVLKHSSSFGRFPPQLAVAFRQSAQLQGSRGVSVRVEFHAEPPCPIAGFVAFEQCQVATQHHCDPNAERRFVDEPVVFSLLA